MAVAGFMTSVGVFVSSRFSGVICTAARRPPLSDKFLIAATGVMVISAFRANVPFGMVRMKRVPSDALAVISPPLFDTVSVTERPWSRLKSIFKGLDGAAIDAAVGLGVDGAGLGCCPPALS